MPAKLLFVDDEPKLRTVIEQLFRAEIRQQTYHLKFAESAPEALQTLMADPAIEIVLTDLNMPRVSGLVLLAQLQEQKSVLNPVLTSIVISAYDDMVNIRKAMNAGAFDFLTKPLDFEDVRLTIAKAVEHVQRLRQAMAQEEQAKQSLLQMNQELERRVKERTTELKKSNAELNAFAHTVAHDLNNPLGIISGYIDYAVDFFSEIDSDELYETLANIQRYTYKSINIVEELLLLAGARNVEAPRLPLDMGELVTNAQRRLHTMIQDYQAEIMTPVRWLRAVGYPPWIEEVWVNLISNGLKYGGVPPRLQVGSQPTDDGQVCFWIKDNGDGISVGDREKLFNEFIRLDQSRARGHGLGLSIVQRIVEKLNGEVGVESEPGQGSKFYFTLPQV